MLANPRPGQRVRVWYGKRYAHTMPLHDRAGRVVIASKGKPRNHLVIVDDRLFVIPCGNLRKERNS